MSAEAIAPKAWATLTARAAMVGYALLRTDSQDGPVRVLAERFGLIQQLGGVADVEELLAEQEGTV